MVKDLGLKNVSVIHGRFESLRKKFHFVIGRAVAPLPKLLRDCYHLCKNAPMLTDKNKFGLGFLYIKGGDFRDELSAANVDLFSEYLVRDLCPHLMESDKKVNFVNSPWD